MSIGLWTYVYEERKEAIDRKSVLDTSHSSFGFLSFDTPYSTLFTPPLHSCAGCHQQFNETSQASGSKGFNVAGEGLRMTEDRDYCDLLHVWSGL